MLASLALSAVLLVSRAVPATGEDLSVLVLEPAGTFAVGVKVEAHVGLIHYALSEDFDRWIAFEKHEAETDDAGRALFEGLPAGALVTVYAHGPGLAGVSEWTGGPCEVLLEPTGSVRGKISAKKVQLRYYTLDVLGPRGLAKQEVALDSKGNFEVEDVAAGDVELRVRMGAWQAGRGAVQVKPGKRAKAPSLKITDQFMTGADPMIEVARIRLVDLEGQPMEGTSFTWVGPQMFGRMVADAEGEVLLAGGNVAIGPPPFVLRLGLIGVDQDLRYLGRLLEVKRGTAHVEVVSQLRKLRVSVRRNGEYVRSFKVFAVTGKGEPRVWEGRPKDGDYELFVPPGAMKLFVGTTDCELRQVDHELDESVEAAELTLDF